MVTMGCELCRGRGCLTRYGQISTGKRMVIKTACKDGRRRHVDVGVALLVE